MFKDPVGVWTVASYLQKIEIQHLLKMLLQWLYSLDLIFQHKSISNKRVKHKMLSTLDLE